MSVTLRNTIVETGAVSTRILTDEKHIAEFASDWHRFDRENATQFNYFQSADWCLNWLASNPDTSPVIITAYLDNKLAMVLPMMHQREFSIDILEILTGADAEYAGPAYTKDIDEKSIFNSVLHALEIDGRFDLLRLNSVLQDASLCSVAEPTNTYPSELQYSSIIEVSSFNNLDDYMATRSRNSRRSLRRKVKDFKKLGNVQARTVPVTAHYKMEIFPLICKWKREWFKENGVLGGNFNSVDMENQLSALCNTADKSEPALATELTLDGQLVAIDVMLQRDGNLYSYVTARNLNYQEFGVGTVIDIHTIEHAISNGFKAIDLLSGPNPSKDSLSTLKVALSDLRFPITQKGSWQASIDRLRVRDFIKTSFYRLPVPVRQTILKLKNRT